MERFGKGAFIGPSPGSFSELNGHFMFSVGKWPGTDDFADPSLFAGQIDMAHLADGQWCFQQETDAAEGQIARHDFMDGRVIGPADDGENRPALKRPAFFPTSFPVFKRAEDLPCRHGGGRRG